jgi:hypothetical protein
MHMPTAHLAQEGCLRPLEHLAPLAGLALVVCLQLLALFENLLALLFALALVPAVFVKEPLVVRWLQSLDCQVPGWKALA